MGIHTKLCIYKYVYIFICLGVYITVTLNNFVQESGGDRTRHFENVDGGFVTGVNVFSPEEQEKLGRRAKRFGLDPSEATILTQKLLKKLYRR